MEDIKAFRTSTNSISTGQVLQHPYDFEKTRLIVKEMTELLVLDLVKKGIVTDQLVLNLGFDIENVLDTEKMKNFKGEVTFDHYGRAVPKGVHGSVNLPEYTSSTKTIMEYMLKLYDQIAERKLTVRRLNVVANHVIAEKRAEELRKEADAHCQMDLLPTMTRRKSKKKHGRNRGSGKKYAEGCH